jgi:hypothetical protein
MKQPEPGKSKRLTEEIETDVWLARRRNKPQRSRNADDVQR